MSPEGEPAARARVAQRAPARWSFAGRMTRLYLVTTSLLVLAVSTTSFLFLERSVAAEIDALTVSAMKAFRFEYEKRMRALESTAPDEEAVELPTELWHEIAATLAQDAPTPCGWRVWKVDWTLVQAEVGHVELLSNEFPRLSNSRETLRLDGGLRTRTEQLGTGFMVGVVLDGSQRYALLRRYETFAAVLMAAAALAALGLGVYVILRVSRMLRSVADRARAVREPTSATVELEDDDAPDEVRDVVEALRQLFSTVREENEKSRVFYASMAHELRSPIQNLVGETEVALFSRPQDVDYRRVLESNLDELRDLGDAIDNLVTICSEKRPQEGSDVLEEFDLLDEARIRLARERSQAERRGVELAVEGQGDLSVRGDREGLLRALRNLAANAIQWSPAGSTVAVRLVGLEGAVDVTVDDAGPGVPPELREEIFRPFVRGPSLNGQRIGYGLGLAIVRSAVDAQGGTIEVGTSEQGGARFHVVLPRSARPRE